MTFSFRIQESMFEADLQNFAKTFLSLSRREPASSVTQVSILEDSLGRQLYIYFDFKIESPDASCRTDSRRFSNISAEDINMRASFDSNKSLWILKPAVMSRGRGLELFTDLQQLDTFLQMYICGYEAKDFKEMKYNHRIERSPSLAKSSISMFWDYHREERCLSQAEL